MKTSPFVGMSQIQQLSLSKSPDARAMMKRATEASRSFAVNISLVQPVTDLVTKQASPVALEQSKTAQQVESGGSKVGLGRSSQLIVS